MQLTLQKNQFNEYYFIEINGSAFELNESKFVFDKYISPKVIDKNKLYIFCGTDSGLLENYIEKNKSELEGCSFIFVDFDYVINLFSFKDLPSNIKVINNHIDIRDLLVSDYFGYVLDEDIVVLPSIAVFDNNPSYIKLYEALKNNVVSLLFQRKVSSGTSFIAAALVNMPFNINNLNNIYNCFKNKTVLVIGAGPSIDDHIDWILANQHKFIIIAVARLAGKLEGLGVDVHFYVSIDPNIESLVNSKALLKIDRSNCAFISLNHASPQLVSQWSGAHFYIGNFLPWHVEYSEALFNIGNTVGHFAVACAFYLGFSTVFMVGMDLCYIGNKTHEASSEEASVGKYGIAFRPKVLNNRGNYAETTVIFEEGIYHLKQMVDYMKKNRSISLFNLSIDAAYIDGVEVLDTSKSIQTDIVDNNLLIQVIQKGLSSLKDRQKAAKDALDSLQSMRQWLSELRNVSLEAIRLLNQNSSGLSGRQYDKLNKLETKLVKLAEKNATFISILNRSGFDRYGYEYARYYENKIDLLIGVELIEFYNKKFSTFLAAAAEGLRLFEDAIFRASFYMRFFAGKISIPDAAEYWLNFGEPGVYRFISDIYRRDFSEAELEAVELLTKCFDSFIIEASTGLKDRFFEQATNISYLINTLKDVIVHQDEQDLLQLKSAFAAALPNESATVEALFKLIVNSNWFSDDVVEQLQSIVFVNNELNIFVLSELLKQALLASRVDLIDDTFKRLCVLDDAYRDSYSKFLDMSTRLS